MICYNVGRRFFTMKDAAETHRKAAGLPPAATQKLEVNGREDLVDLLNTLVEGLLQQDDVDNDERGATGPQPIPDYVPKFLHPK